MKAYDLRQGDLFTINNHTRREVYEALADYDGGDDVRCIVRMQLTGLGWRMAPDHYIQRPVGGKGSGKGRKKPQRISLETTCNPYAYVTLLDIPKVS